MENNKYSAENFEYKEEDYWIKQINNLDRYENSFGSDYGDCWGEMIQSKEGDWVSLEDVLNLFSAKKE